jgi:hypothetical protein
VVEKKYYTLIRPLELHCILSNVFLICMNQFQNHPDFYDKPIRLSEEQRAEPVGVLRLFFQNCHLHEIRKTLWKMLETSLTVRYSIFDDAAERSHLFWFYRELETMVEASFLLCDRLPPDDLSSLSYPASRESQPIWKTKSMLEDEIRRLRIRNAEMETELIELRHGSRTGK